MSGGAHVQWHGHAVPCPPVLGRLTLPERSGTQVLEATKKAFRPRTGAIMRRALRKLRLPPASMGTGGGAAPETETAAEAETSRSSDAAKPRSAAKLQRAKRASKGTPAAPEEADLAEAQRQCRTF